MNSEPSSGRKELKPFAIALSADLNMEVPLHVALLSLLEHFESPVLYPHFHLLLSGFSPRQVGGLRATLDQTGKAYELTVLVPDLEPFKPLLGLHGNHMIYARLLLPDLLEADRFLYLDADTLVMINVAPLYAEDLQGCPIAAVLGTTMQHSLENELLADLGLDLNSPYFNSGVILFDARVWKRDGMLARCLEFGRQHSKDTLSMDQSILNVVMHGRVHALPLQFNLECYPEGAVQRGKGQASLYHFVGSPKPWDLFGELVHSSYALWAAWAEKTVLGRGDFRKYLQPRRFWRSLRIKGSYWRVLRRRFVK